MHVVKIIVSILLLSLVALFTFQNTEAATVRLFIWSCSLSVSLMLLASLFCGIFMGLLLSYTHSWRKRRKLRQPPEPHAGADF